MQENEKPQADVLYEVCEDVFEKWNGENDSEYVKPLLKDKLCGVMDDEAAEKSAAEIVSVIEMQNQSLSSLENARKNGRTSESWLTDKLKSAAECLPEHKTAEYLESLDMELENANNMMHNTFLRSDGQINQGRNLDGFLAEQYHAQKFNLNAAANESDLRAVALEPAPGKTYAKNSVDVAVKDNYGSGMINQRYQLKYGKTAEETIKYIKHGNYRGQQLVVPAEQVEAVQKAFPDRMVSAQVHTDRISGAELTKEQAKELQHDAQGEKWKDFGWNDYSFKAVARGICKNSGKAAAFAASVSVLADAVKCLREDEHPKLSQIIKNALTSGADAGFKCMLAGALKIGAEKGLLSFIPQGTPAGVLACMAHLAVETIKTAYKVGKGEISAVEGIIRLEQTAIACIGGMIGAFIGGQLGMAAGEAIGVVFGPVGATVGAVVGKTVGSMVGFAVGEAVGKVIAKGFQKLAAAAASTIKSLVSKAAGKLSAITTRLVKA